MSTAPFAVSPELTAIAIAYANAPDAYIADQVLPRVQPVGRKEFSYSIRDLSSFDRPDTLVGRRGRPGEAGWAERIQTAAVLDYGLEDPIPLDDLEQARAMGRDLLGESVEYIMGLVKLDRECRVAALAQDRTNC